MKHILVNQAEFRQERSCCDLVLAVTSYIKKGINGMQKVRAVCIDLTAAYDTLWIEGYINKLSQNISCEKLVNLISNLPNNGNCNKAWLHD